MRETIFLVPGLLCDATIWSHQASSLAQGYDVRIPDLGGFTSIEAMADAILCDAPSRFSLAGHSMGARVVLQIAAVAPGRVRRLALLDTGTKPLQPGELERRQALLQVSGKLGMRALAEQWLPGMVREGALTRDEKLKAALLAMVERMTPTIHANQITALLHRPDARPTLAKITCPVLIGVGEQDRWSPPAQHVAMAAKIPHARYIVFPQAGHMAPLEAPMSVTSALQNWMTTSEIFD